MEIRWSQGARRDLRSLRDYIALDSPRNARQFCDRLLAAIERLADFPKSGRPVPEAENSPEEIRELIFRDYRAIYLATPDCVHMLAVIHGARNLTAMGRKPWE